MADLPSRNVALTIVESGFMIALNIMSLGEKYHGVYSRVQEYKTTFYH